MGAVTNYKSSNHTSSNNAKFTESTNNTTDDLMRSNGATNSNGKVAHRNPSEEEIPPTSDVSVIVDGVSYALHKLPLMRHSGWMRRAIEDSSAATNHGGEVIIEIPDSESFPGGSETFELVAKFCYGHYYGDHEMDPRTVAPLRCAAEYLDMSETYAPANLISRTDSYLTSRHILHNLRNIVLVLRSCERLLPIAEELGIVKRCVAAACDHILSYNAPPIHSVRSSPSASHHHFGSSRPPNGNPAESWIEDLSLLGIHFFHRVLSAVKAHGTARPESLASAVAHYANNFPPLRALLKKPNSFAKLKRGGGRRGRSAEHELVEKLVSLLPTQPNVCSVGFLLAMLRAAIFIDASIVCRIDLEKRIGWQLEQAAVDDLLIPSYATSRVAATDSDTTLFDLDTVARIVVSFLEHDRMRSEGDLLLDGAPDEMQSLFDLDQSSTDPYSSSSPPPQSKIMKVARLLDYFLAEVAPDANLSAAKFTAFGELMPEYARVVDDGLYRAIDIYLKAHPMLDELDRKKICSLMDCQKLSQEACRHAAQNERLPVQVTVQVLYFEQMRLRKNYANVTSTDQSPHIVNENTTPLISPKDREYMAAMQRENMELKMEVNRMKTRLQINNKFRADEAGSEREGEESTNEDEEFIEGKIDKRAIVGYNGTPNNASNGTRGKSRFFESMSRKLGKLNPFGRNTSNVESGLKVSSNADVRTSRRARRHSMS